MRHPLNEVGAAGIRMRSRKCQPNWLDCVANFTAPYRLYVVAHRCHDLNGNPACHE
jgi:hypothetical protein